MECSTKTDRRGDSFKKWVTKKVVRGKVYKRLTNVECPPHNPHCSIYGLSMVQCIFTIDPMEKFNLDKAHQYCQFMTKELSNMDRRTTSSDT